MDEPVSHLKGFGQGVVFGLVVGAVAVLVATTAIVDERNELAKQLERTNLRLEEARQNCAPREVRCSPRAPATGDWPL